MAHEDRENEEADRADWLERKLANELRACA
jgi:hypothetical protein